MSSAIRFNLDQSKILSSDIIGLTLDNISPDFNGFREEWFWKKKKEKYET